MPHPPATATLSIASPDGNLVTAVGGDAPIRLTIRQGAGYRYDEPALEHQLEQLARLARIGLLRTRRADREESSRAVNTADPRRRRYREALRLIEATGESAAGSVVVSTTGYEHWTFSIVRGTMRRLSEEELTAEVESAVAGAISGYERQAVLLKDECFGFDLPPAVRRRLDGVHA